MVWYVLVNEPKFFHVLLRNVEIKIKKSEFKFWKNVYYTYVLIVDVQGEVIRAKNYKNIVLNIQF